MRYEPIYTEQTECRDCYKCVRVCPVKAIQVQNGSAVIIHDRCIFCGKCVDICPAHAKRIRNDVPRARQLIKDREHVYASIAPSYVTEFSGYEKELLQALKVLGFTGISETSLGAEIVSEKIDKLLSIDHEFPLISSACPTVVEAIRKYYPELIGLLTQIRSPLGAHAMLLRKLYGDDIGIIFIGPCISKKLEADRNAGAPDIALTFRELREWFSECGVDLHNPVTLSKPLSGNYTDPSSVWFGLEGEDPSSHMKTETVSLVPRMAYKTTNYALENGMISSLEGGDVELQDRTTSISGTKEVLASLECLSDSLSQGHTAHTIMPAFFELLSCEGGCINGPGCLEPISPVIRKVLNSQYTRSRMRLFDHSLPGRRFELKDSVNYTYNAAPNAEEMKEVPSEYEIEQALKRLGKADEQERLDCGGCGYNSCRDFAVAYISGMAEPEMCVTKMRKQAQSKVDMLLRTLPMGVVIIDNCYQIIDCNAQFLKMFSSITYDADDQELNKVSGLKLNSFIDLKPYLTEAFSDNQSVYERTVHYEDRIIDITFFSIDKKWLFGALFQDITEVTQHRDAVMRRAEDVIQKNLQSVQQIASLLGENAAETEIMLSSLIDMFEYDGENDGEREP